MALCLRRFAARTGLRVFERSFPGILMAMRKLLKHFAFLLTGFAVFAYAQVDTGSISGTVKDSGGSVIVDATVTITNPSSGASVTTKTNQDGFYTVVDLKPGTYNVATAAPGFQAITKTGIDLRLQDRLAINFDSQVGQASTSIQEQDTAPALETETSSLGQVVESHAIESLPLNGR